MKIKIKKQQDEKQKSILDKRIKLPNNIRLGVIGFLFLLLLFSVFNATATEEQSQINLKTNTLYSYSQNAQYDYTVHLINNTVYEGKTTIKPQDNLIIFRNIVNYIEATFTYTFTCTEQAKINGEYQLIAKIKTDMWSKQYTLSKGEFNNTFQEQFVIDYEFYENVTNTINTETGVTASNPQLIFECNILNVKLETNIEKTRLENFNPSISIPLNDKIIDISQNLKSNIPGEKTETEKTITQKPTQQKDQWTSNSFIFIIIMILFSAVTRGDIKKLNETEKQVKKINKKYNEWIVEVDKTPKRPLGAETVNMKSIEDLIKISEELGKPILYHESGEDGAYSYYVLDENVFFKYVLYDQEKFINYFVKQKENSNPSQPQQ